MRTQLEKNKDLLEEKIEQYSNRPMTDSVAEHLSVYRGAYKAISMLEKKQHAQSSKGISERSAAYIEDNESIPLDWSAAMEWTGHMKNSDGTKGPHWSAEQIQQVMKKLDINCDPVQFYAVFNAVYSDYCAVAKKHKVDTIEFYADLANAWLDDADAVEDKAKAYFDCIVKH